MSRKKLQKCVFIIWLISFVFCLGVPIYFNNAIKPELLFSKLMNEVLETFAPPLSIMLALFFSKAYLTTSSEKYDNFTVVISMIISLIYVSLFCFFMLKFCLYASGPGPSVDSDKNPYDAEGLINLFTLIRPKVSFLVIFVNTFLFVKKD